MFGEELPTIFSKRELVEVISEHAESGKSDIREDVERIARGAFTFGDKKITEESLAFSVSDSGMGIPLNQQEYLLSFVLLYK